MKRALLVVALVGAACWRSSPPPPSPPPSPPPAPAARPAHAPPPLSDVDRLFQAFEGFADDMCNCVDMACAQRVSDDMTKWSQELTKNQSEAPKLTDEETQRATTIAERLGRCMQNAMSGAAAGSASTP